MLSRAASKLVSLLFQRECTISQHGYRYSFNIQFSTNTNKDTCKQVEVISLSLTHLASSTSSRPRKRLGKMSGGSKSRSCTCQECCAGIHPQIWQGARPRMFTPPRCEPGALHPARSPPIRSVNTWLCRRAPYRAPPRPYAAATVRAPQPKVKDEKPPGGAFTRDEERPPCRPLPSAACHGALFSPVGSMARR